MAIQWQNFWMVRQFTGRDPGRHDAEAATDSLPQRRWESVNS